MTSRPRPRTGMAHVGVAALGLVFGALTMSGCGAESDPMLDRDDLAEAPMVSGSAVRFAQTLVGEFSAPVEIVVRPGDVRLFVVQRAGQLVIVQEGVAIIALDISDQTITEGEYGMLGAAFHPVEDFLYVHYSDRAGTSIVAEFAVDPSTGLAERASERHVLSVEQPYDNHNGGELAFGPDGYLYIGLGDGGRSGDPVRSALDLTSRLGKILRIDPRPSEAGDPFTVPQDNPFVDVEDADPTIWSYGLRNPWRFSFDAVTGDLWIADVGQNAFEEVNRSVAADGPAGRATNFGWSAFEGFEPFNSDQPSDDHTEPFLIYGRDNGNCSISGGAVYRGTAVPSLDGWYVFGDYCTGLIWGVDTGAQGPPTMVELGQVDELVAIVSGADRELYAVSIAGRVYGLT